MAAVYPRASSKRHIHDVYVGRIYSCSVICSDVTDRAPSFGPATCTTKLARFGSAAFLHETVPALGVSGFDFE